VRLREPVSLQSLKIEWLEMLRSARDLVSCLPVSEVGCLYLGERGEPVTPDPDAPSLSGLTRHFGQLKGSWPRVVE